MHVLEAPKPLPRLTPRKRQVHNKDLFEDNDNDNDTNSKKNKVGQLT
jgi:hypothetical protein